MAKKKKSKKDELPPWVTDPTPPHLEIVQIRAKDFIHILQQDNAQNGIRCGGGQCKYGAESADGCSFKAVTLKKGICPYYNPEPSESMRRKDLPSKYLETATCPHYKRIGELTLGSPRPEHKIELRVQDFLRILEQDRHHGSIRCVGGCKYKTGAADRCAFKGATLTKGICPHYDPSPVETVDRKDVPKKFWDR